MLQSTSDLATHFMQCGNLGANLTLAPGERMVITDDILREEQDTAQLLEQAARKGSRDRKQSVPLKPRKGIGGMAYNEILAIVVDLDEQMKEAAKELKFELAARLRDEISELKYELRQIEKAGHA